MLWAIGLSAYRVLWRQVLWHATSTTCDQAPEWTSSRSVRAGLAFVPEERSAAALGRWSHAGKTEKFAVLCFAASGDNKSVVPSASADGAAAPRVVSRAVCHPRLLQSAG